MNNSFCHRIIAATCVAAAIVAGTAFAQVPSAAHDVIIAPNTVTYDFGPTIIGMMLNSVAKGLSDDIGDDGGGWGFGFALQYERQLDAKHSVGGRIAYLGGTVNFSDPGYADPYDPDYGWDPYSAQLRVPAWAFEVNGRIYPYASSFFVNGMMGIGTLGVGITGDIEVYQRESSRYVTKFVDDDFMTAFFKLGVKSGWRWVTGENGGLTVELSAGYNVATGIGKSISKKMAEKIGDDPEAALDMAFEFLGASFFHGGFRMTLGVGWQF